jgi:hypothetical protein
MVLVSCVCRAIVELLEVLARFLNFFPPSLFVKPAVLRKKFISFEIILCIVYFLPLINIPSFQHHLMINFTDHNVQRLNII